MPASPNKPHNRRTQERSETTKLKLIKVAIKEFSERGFDAISVSDLEILAGVQRNLVNYHFGSKKELWKAAVSHCFGQLADYSEGRGELIRDISSTRERIAFIIRSFIRFCAKHPELNRLMVQEGIQDSWRIKWLVKSQVRPLMLSIRELVEHDLGLNDEEFVNWYYLLTGGGSMIFSVSVEAQLLFDVDTSSADVVERHVEMLTSALMFKMPNVDNNKN